MTPVTDTTDRKDDAVGHKIRTTITPGEVLEVDDVTLTDLSRQGLVHSSESGEHGNHKWKAEAETSKADEQSGAAGKKGE